MPGVLVIASRRLEEPEMPPGETGRRDPPRLPASLGEKP